MRHLVLFVTATLAFGGAQIYPPYRRPSNYRPVRKPYTRTPTVQPSPVQSVRDAVNRNIRLLVERGAITLVSARKWNLQSDRLNKEECAEFRYGEMYMKACGMFRVPSRRVIPRWASPWKPYRPPVRSNYWRIKHNANRRRYISTNRRQTPRPRPSLSWLPRATPRRGKVGILITGATTPPTNRANDIGALLKKLNSSS